MLTLLRLWCSEDLPPDILIPLHTVQNNAEECGVLLQFPWAPRQLLHAVRMRVTHPRTGEPLDLQAPLPSDFKDALERVQLPCKLPDCLPALPEK